MAQQNIEYGAYPDDINADAIRIAFQKTQNNFTELYGNLSNVASNVTAITAGTGIVTSGSTGNVTINSTFSSLSVHSDTLTVTGVGGAIPPGGTANSDYSVNAATDTLILEMNANVSFNSVTSNIAVSNVANISTLNANDVVVANVVTMAALQFTGLSADPTASPGLMYYNSISGELKIYNGVLAQWQSLN
jgi:hypothetical protein